MKTTVKSIKLKSLHKAPQPLIDHMSFLAWKAAVSLPEVKYIEEGAGVVCGSVWREGC